MRSSTGEVMGVKVSTVLRAGDMEVQRYRNHGADEDTVLIDRTGMRAWLTEGEAESLWTMLGALLGKTPAVAGPTVPVRIAVAVQDEGAWAAAGHAGMPEGGTNPGDARLARHALADLDGLAPTGRRHVVYVTASVPLPQSVEVQGSVET